MGGEKKEKEEVVGTPATKRGKETEICEPERPQTEVVYLVNGGQKMFLFTMPFCAMIGMNERSHCFKDENNEYYSVKGVV